LREFERYSLFYGRQLAQGEENEIVILSLVRSNTRGKLGFIEDKNKDKCGLCQEGEDRVYTFWEILR
jgi:hypothetical protein